MYDTLEFPRRIFKSFKKDIDIKKGNDNESGEKFVI